jgi:hypothetical protein
MTSDDVDKDARRTRPFSDVLRELDKGRVHTELSERLQEVIEAVMGVRKSGTVQLTLKVDAAKGDAMVEVVASVAAKKPRVARTSMFYVDDEHNLSRTNPDQPFLPLSGVPGDGATQPDADTRRTAR